MRFGRATALQSASKFFVLACKVDSSSAGGWCRFAVPFILFCGAVHIVSWGRSCFFCIFAYSQTIVCLQANECLTTGKRSNGALIAPQVILLCSSIHARPFLFLCWNAFWLCCPCIFFVGFLSFLVFNDQFGFRGKAFCSYTRACAHIIKRYIETAGLTYIKSGNFFAWKLKFFLEKFWWFGKKSYLCIRFQGDTWQAA